MTVADGAAAMTSAGHPRRIPCRGSSRYLRPTSTDADACACPGCSFAVLLHGASIIREPSVAHRARPGLDAPHPSPVGLPHHRSLRHWQSSPARPRLPPGHQEARGLELLFTIHNTEIAVPGSRRANVAGVQPSSATLPSGPRVVEVALHHLGPRTITRRSTRLQFLTPVAGIDDPRLGVGHLTPIVPACCPRQRRLAGPGLPRSSRTPRRPRVLRTSRTRTHSRSSAAAPE